MGATSSTVRSMPPEHCLPSAARHATVLFSTLLTRTFAVLLWNDGHAQFGVQVDIRARCSSVEINVST